jgi:hypothetical protein
MPQRASILTVDHHGDESTTYYRNMDEIRYVQYDHEVFLFDEDLHFGK